jgi:hypothetical protein
MNFLLNKRSNDIDIDAIVQTKNVDRQHHQHKKQRNVSTDSTDSTIPSQWGVFGLLEDSGIATSNDAHSLEFDDHLPTTPPPTIVINQHRIEQPKVTSTHKSNERLGFLDKSKASTSVPSLSINSNATINIHYYPEESIFWSYVIVAIALIVQLFMHGIQLSFGVFLLILLNHFRKDNIYLVEVG